MKARNYCELLAWQRAMDLVEVVYRATGRFPREEISGLTGQLRRAVVSVPSNIAEGQGRKSLGEFLHHLAVASASLGEVETYLLIAKRLAYLTEPEAEILLDLAGDVGRLITGLSHSLSR